MTVEPFWYFYTSIHPEHTTQRQSRERYHVFLLSVIVAYDLSKINIYHCWILNCMETILSGMFLYWI